MTEYDILQALKVELGLSPTTTVYDGRLSQIIRSAIERVKRAGVADLDIENNIADGQLVLMYAQWQWRSRDTGAAMPAMVRAALHDRVAGAVRSE